MDEPSYRIRVLSDPETVAELAAELGHHAGVSGIEEAEPAEAGDLDLVLETIAAIVFLAQATVLDTSLVTALKNVFKRKGTKVITIEGEFGRVTVEVDRDLAGDVLERMMAGLRGAPPGAAAPV